MKLLRPLLLIVTITLTSCSTIKVTTDYDTKVDFNQYRTFAFYKPGIDKAQISDLDKKRILRAIESELTAIGFVKSNNPDMLVSIFTKSRDRLNINQGANVGFGWGWGWNPWMFGGMNNMNVSQYTEGTLFIDFIDQRKKELIWQGMGTGALKTKNVRKKQKRIKEFVREIIEKYPPQQRRRR